MRRPVALPAPGRPRGGWEVKLGRILKREHKLLYRSRCEDCAQVVEVSFFFEGTDK